MVRFCSASPVHYYSALYSEVHGALKQNENYADKLRLKTRCVTVDYAGDFHLDVVPRAPLVDEEA